MYSKAGSLFVDKPLAMNGKKEEKPPLITEKVNAFFFFSFQVMKDWSDLEEKYQEMREKDPASAEDFKKKMTERFQKTVQVRPLKLLLEPLKNTVLPKTFFQLMI